MNAVVVARTRELRAAVLGGWQPGWTAFAWTSFQIVSPEGTIVVDAPVPEALQQELREAATIVVTHEHPDHVGGLVRSPFWDELRGSVRFTREQLARGGELARRLAPHELADLRPLVYSGAFALAPGVVLVGAAGHTPGSQLVFVQQADGRELVLAGDVAWRAEQVREPRGHPLLSGWLLGEDGSAVASQLRALHELERAGVRVVPSHDEARIRELVAEGWLREGFARVAGERRVR